MKSPMSDWRGQIRGAGSEAVPATAGLEGARSRGAAEPFKVRP
jgi:hypothetical protein